MKTKELILHSIFWVLIYILTTFIIGTLNMSPNVYIPVSFLIYCVATSVAFVSSRGLHVLFVNNRFLAIQAFRYKKNQVKYDKWKRNKRVQKKYKQQIKRK